MAESICFISLPAYGYFSGGPAFGSRQFYLLSLHLRQDFEVSFIVGDYGQPRRKRRRGVTLYRAYRPVTDASQFRRVGQAVKFADAVHRSGADLFFVEGRPAKLLFYVPIIAAQGGKVVYHVVSDEHVEAQCAGVGPSALAGIHAMLRRLDGVVTQNEYQRESLKVLHGIGSTVIPSGYPPAESVLPHHSRECLLWVGRLERRLKRPHLYLDIAEEVPEAEFLLAGPKEDEEYAASLLGRVSSLGNVTYLGSVPPGEIHQYYRRAIALVNTSAKEGFPNTFLEAWRYATPVLSLSVDPNRFLDTPDSACFGNDDFEELVAVTRRASTSTALRERIGRDGLETFRNNYQIERVADSYRDLIESTCGDK